jgi:hypothetical protein
MAREKGLLSWRKNEARVLARIITELEKLDEAARERVLDHLAAMRASAATTPPPPTRS